MSLEILGRVIENATAKEIDFLIYSIRFQDNLGVVKGITRKEVCKALEIHKSKFYHILQSLENKLIIRVFWSEKRLGFWTFAVIENSFTCKDDYKKGYINLNTKFLWSENFLRLTKNEKVICLKILSVYRENRRNIVLRFATLAEWTGSSIQSVKKFISSIETVFGYIKTIGNNIIEIDLSESFDAFSRTFKFESDTHNEHLLNYILAAKKVNSIHGNDVKDTLNIFRALGGKFGFNSVVAAVLNSIDNYGRLIPKYINKMTQLAGQRKVMIELFY